MPVEWICVLNSIWQVLGITFDIINQLCSISCLLCFQEMPLGRIQQVEGLYAFSTHICKYSPIWGFPGVLTK